MSDREKLKRYEWIFSIIIVLGLLLMNVSREYVILSLLGGAIAIVGMILYFKTRKCPHCNCSLWGVRFLPEYCPHCGKEIK